MKRPPIRRDLALVEGYHSPQLDVEVRLNTNEAPEPPPPAFAEELQRIVPGIDWNRYPDRSASELRSRIAALEGVAADQVLAANGSNEVLQTICLVYGGFGSTVAVFEPTYALHSHIARVTGAAVAEGGRSPDFELDLDEVERVIDQARPEIVFLCSPNNPTGMLDPAPALERVLELAPGLVVVDEAYGQFAPRSALELVDEEHRLVVTRTFSKTWSMAGARLGYAVGPRWMVPELEKVLLPYHLDSFKQAAGIAALGFEQEMRNRVQRLVDERTRLSAAMAELEVRTWPSDANFILFRPESIAGDEVWQGLVDRGVLVRNCSSWRGLTDCLRVTVGTPTENDRFVGALEEVLDRG